MSTRQPLASAREDRVSQEHNREANGGNAFGEDGSRRVLTSAVNDGSGIGLVRVMRAKQARMK